MTLKIEKRRTGKTTGAILVAIGKAIQNPGKLVSVEDPDLKTAAQAKYVWERARKLVELLDLKGLEISHNPGVYVRAEQIGTYMINGSDSIKITPDTTKLINILIDTNKKLGL